jgi:uncharacterized membrane protein
MTTLPAAAPDDSGLEALLVVAEPLAAVALAAVALAVPVAVLELELLEHAVTAASATAPKAASPAVTAVLIGIFCPFERFFVSFHIMSGDDARR